jgi:hypothetical protein
MGKSHGGSRRGENRLPFERNLDVKAEMADRLTPHSLDP